MRSRNVANSVLMLTAALVLAAACGSQAPKSAIPTTSRPLNTSSSTSASTSTLEVTTTVPPVSAFLYVYPFSSLSEAESWQREANPGGHQPWHFDAGFIATSFAKALGVPQIGQVIKVGEDATGVHVALGFHNPNGVPVTVWTVHLVRVGSGSGRPWEVVGDDQSSDFTHDAVLRRVRLVAPACRRSHHRGRREHTCSRSIREFQLARSASAAANQPAVSRRRGPSRLPSPARPLRCS